MERLELRQIRYFLVVAETLHFGLAANKVGLAQPDLIFQIKEIERAIGHALFLRSSQEVSLTLTPAGSYLLARLEDVQASFEDAIQATRQIGNGKKVHIAIGFSGSAMYTRLPIALDRFRRAYPDAEIELREVSVHEHTPLLLDGKLDVGFIRDGPETYGLRMIPVVREPFQVLLPQSHALTTEQSPLEPEALKKERFVLLSPRAAWLTFERTMAIFRSTDFTPEISMEAPDWVSVASLVASGMGVSVAPQSVSQFKVPGTVFRPLSSEARSFVDVWTANSIRNPATAHLLNIIEEEFAPVV